MTRPLPPDWEKRRELVLQRDQICQAEKCIKPAHHVDHKVPRSLGGSDAVENLQGLCAKHHGQKTYEEKVDPFSFIEGDPPT